MNSFRADLHCHSHYSDGEDDPLDLIAKAKAADLQGLSITDHDTMQAYSPLLFDTAKQAGIRLLTGIELSSELYGISVHVLGYGYDLESISLQNFLVEMKERRRKRNRWILQKLTQLRMPIDEEEFLAFFQGKIDRVMGRPHIAQFMVYKKYVSSPQEAFERYLKEGASCYVAAIKFHPQDAIDQIHLASGKAILAHPHFLKKGSFKREVLSLPFDGIESHYGTLSKEQERPWIELAEKRNWIATGGSDYHGSFKPHISLGCSWVNESVFNSLCPR